MANFVDILFKGKKSKQQDANIKKLLDKIFKSIQQKGETKTLSLGRLDKKDVEILNDFRQLLGDLDPNLNIQLEKNNNKDFLRNIKLFNQSPLELKRPLSEQDSLSGLGGEAGVGFILQAIKSLQEPKDSSIFNEFLR